MCDFGWPWLNQTDKEHILRGMECGQVFQTPRAVQIDWTDRCNLGCFFCSQGDVRHGHELSRPTLENLFCQLDEWGVSSLQVAGGGEPLCHRDIGEILDSIRHRHDFTVGTLVTNGLSLTKEIREPVLRAASNRLIISLNSFGGSDYAEFTGTTEQTFYRVVENIRELTWLKRKLDLTTPTIFLQYLIHDRNFSLLPSMLEQARELEVDALIFNPIHNHGEWSRLIAADPSVFVDAVQRVFQADSGGIIEDVQTVHPEVNRAIIRLRETEFAEQYPAVVARHRRFLNLEAHCPLPWYFLHIKATGDVYPCCFLIRPDGTPVGNIHSNPLDSIWMGDEFGALRKQMARRVRTRRRGDAVDAAADDLPSHCTDGTCMIRHLPYIDDAGFYTRVDCVGRAPINDQVSFPDRLTDGRPAEINGASPFPSERVRVRINHQHAGSADSHGDRFSFSFVPNGLSRGFHLIDVVDGAGAVFAASRVEKD